MSFRGSLRFLFVFTALAGLAAAPPSAEACWRAFGVLGSHDGPRLTWKNVPGTVVNRPEAIHRPTTTAEVAEIVRDANEKGLKVRPVAAGHSWSPITRSDQILVDTRGLNRMLGHEPPRKEGDPHLVTFQTGMRITDLIDALGERGLTLSNYGAIKFQTLGGVLATNTHGTGVGKPGFVGHVESFKLVDGTGKIHFVSRTENPELFRAALSGIGTVGVITEVTLRAEPKFNIEITSRTYSLEALTKPRTENDPASTPLQELVGQREWFHLIWLAGTDVVFTQSGDRTDKPAPPRPRAAAVETFSRNYIQVPFTHLASRFRGTLWSALPTLGRVASALSKPSTKVEENTHAFTSRINPKNWAFEQQAEFYLPREYAEKALLRLQKLFADLRKEGINAPAPFVWLRFVKGDDTYLSPTYNVGPHREWVAIDVYDTKDMTVLPRMKEALAELVPGQPELFRSHLGKTQLDTPEEVRSRFVHWDAFNQVRRQADPNGTFLNPWTEPLFQPGPSQGR